MTVETFELRPGYVIPRIIKGGWQIAEDHSNADIAVAKAAQDMIAFAKAGITAFDCGDVYLGVEEKIGAFLELYKKSEGAVAAGKVKVHTKFIPAFLEDEALRQLTPRICEDTIDLSRRRLGQDRLDLVQLHWWNYDIPGNLEMAQTLKKLQEKGKIDKLGGTNYNVRHMQEMVAGGVDLMVNQVQYSLFDRRPENGMIDFCAANNCKLVCYGSLAGGFLSKKWLNLPDPGRPAFENVSLDKYYRIINDFGGWGLYQELLSLLERIAAKHKVSIANVASRYVLERPQVAAIIIGARHIGQLDENLQVFSFALDASDYRLINAVLAKSTGPAGDCYDLDREENRDALEEVKTKYFDVENGRLVEKTRDTKVIQHAYGHHLKHP